MAADCAAPAARNLHKLLKPDDPWSGCRGVEHDPNYLFMRAEAEEAIAAQTPEGEARECHLRLAELYRRTAIERSSKSLGDHDLSAPEATPEPPEAS